MSADTLGTLFGLLLLAPIGMSPADLHRQHASLSRLATLIIEQGSAGVFSIPVTLAEDVQRNLTADNCHLSTRSVSTDSGVDSLSLDSQDSHDANSSSPPVIYTGVVFTRRSSQDRNRTPYTNLSDTELAVAELCATVQALPDTDPRKTRLVQRINNSNGGLVPGLQVEYRRIREALLSPSKTPFRRNGNSASAQSVPTALKSSARRKMPEKGLSAKRCCPDTNAVSNVINSATASSSSLEGSSCAPFCVPFANALASPFRRPNNTITVNSYTKKEELLPLDIGTTEYGSPIFSGVFNPIQLSMSGASDYLEPVEMPDSTMAEILGRQVQRRSSGLFNLRVRRNYMSPLRDLNRVFEGDMKVDDSSPSSLSSIM